MAPQTASDVIAQGKYLEPGYDPSKLTIAVLLGVLHYHGAAPPLPHNKATLVRAFQENIAPHNVRLGAERLARQGSQASDEGILDGMTGRQINQPSRKSEAAGRASKEPAKQRKRTTGTQQVPLYRDEVVPLKDDDDEIVEDSEPEDAVPRVVSNKRRVSKGRRLSDLDGTELSDGAGEWSMENPFQSGVDSSSPARPSTSRKRASAAPQQRATSRKSQVPSSPSPPQEEAPPPQRRLSAPPRRVAAPARAPPRPRTPSPEEEEDQQEEAFDELEAADGLDTSFALDEGDAQNAQVARRLAGGQLVPYQQPIGGSFSTPTSLMLLLLLALSGVLLEIYKYQSATIGFCNPGSDSNAVLRVREAQRLSAAACSRRIAASHRDSNGDAQVEDCTPLPLVPLPSPTKCTPCPAHAATCSADGSVTCDNGYVVQHHPLSYVPALSSLLDGLPGIGPISFPPRCVEDVHTKNVVFTLAKAMELYLERRRGERVCAGSVASETEQGEAKQWGVPIRELKHSFESHPRAKHLKAEGKFDELFAQAKSHLVRSSRAVTGIDSTGEEYVAAKRADMTLACTVRVRARQTWEEWRIAVFGLLGTFGALAYARRSFASRMQERARVAGLVQTALDALRTQEFDHHTDPASTRHAFLSPPQLRDWVLQDEHSVSARKRLWSKVEKVVESNANVRANVEETDGGEETRVWRWVGSSAPRAVKYETPRQRIVA